MITKLSKDMAIKNFRDHWNWLSENPQAKKAEWPGWNFNQMPLCQNCFLCEFVRQHKDPSNRSQSLDKEECEDYCPVAWNDKGHVCHKFGELYHLWNRTKELSQKSKLAKKISKLPEKEIEMVVYEFTRKYEDGFSVSDLEEAGACEDQLYRFAFEAMKAEYSFSEEISEVKDVIKFAGKDDNIQWLIDKGFLLDDSRTFACGQLFKDTQDDDRGKVMLVRVSKSEMAMVDLIDGETFCLQPVKVKDTNAVTVAEMREMIDDFQGLEPIEKDF